MNRVIEITIISDGTYHINDSEIIEFIAYRVLPLYNTTIEDVSEISKKSDYAGTMIAVRFGQNSISILKLYEYDLKMPSIEYMDLEIFSNKYIQKVYSSLGILKYREYTKIYPL